jgi:hypothetical protein
MSLVVWAISEGHKAAWAANAYLAGLGEEPGEDPVGAAERVTPTSRSHPPRAAA